MKKNTEGKGTFLQRAFAWAVIVLTFLFILSLFRNMGKARKVEEAVRLKEEKIKKIEVKNEEIKKKLEEVKSEEYIEKKFRDDLGLAKEGEIVFILPDEEILKSLVPRLPDEEETLPDPIWKKWLKLFDIRF